MSIYVKFPITKPVQSVLPLEDFEHSEWIDYIAFMYSNKLVKECSAADMTKVFLVPQQMEKALHQLHQLLSVTSGLSQSVPWTFRSRNGNLQHLSLWLDWVSILVISKIRVSTMNVGGRMHLKTVKLITIRNSVYTAYTRNSTVYHIVYV